MKAPRVLIVDDEPETRKYVGANLRARGYEILVAEDGRAALKTLAEQLINLVILDITMPGVDGFTVCETLRRQATMPIMMLSARGQERDIVRALDLGADDYLTKPFGADELLARVRALLRRVNQLPASPRPALVIDAFMIDFGGRRVTVNAVPIHLTSTEYDLLAYLTLNAGRVLTHRQLLQTVWGAEYGAETDYLWAYIRRLRRKIESDPSNPRYLLTLPGVGYSFAAE